MRRLGALLGSVWLLGGTLTALHATDPGAFAVTSEASAPVFETFATAGALLLSALFYGRFRQRRWLPDLLGCVAFAVIGAGNFAFGVLPLLAAPHMQWQVLRPVALLTGLAASLVFVAAAMGPAVEVRRRHVLVLGTAMAVFSGAIAILAWRYGSHFAMVSGPSSGDATSDPDNAAVTGIQVATACAYALASLRFFTSGARVGDLFYGWLGVAGAMWALARVNFAVTPAHYAGAITLGDWLRLSAYSVAVLAAGSEFTAYWHELAQKAVLEERRRIARDLHDGLAQELAFITTQSTRVAGAPTKDGALLLSRAAQRALDESRRAVAALTAPIEEPLDVALLREAEELSTRLGVRVLPNLEPAGKVSVETRETVLRIAREAITNAARHGRPTKINVSLTNHDGVTLRVVDNGHGFRPAAFANGTASGHYGIAGMRERAEALGGRVTIDSRLYSGTTVVMWVP